MNLKKEVLASLLVSSMFVTLAGPIPVGAGAEEERTKNKHQAAVFKLIKRLLPICKRP